MLSILKQVLDEHGVNLSKSQYDIIARGKLPNSKCYRLRFGSWNRSKFKSMNGNLSNSSGLTNLQKDILNQIKQSKSIIEISNAVDRGPETIIFEINKLEKMGFSIETVPLGNSQQVTLLKEPKPNKKITEEIFKGKTIKFGVVSDTHLGSKFERLDLLESFYKTCLSEGIKTIYHAGDLLDGQNVYKGQEYEIKFMGADKQVEYCVDNYPKVEGITTKFITGNHDLSYHKRSGLDIGIGIASGRDDLVYLGQEEADIHLQTEEVKPAKPVKLRLFHPGGTQSAYALSYRAQRTIETYASGEKPAILVIGHLHKASYFFIRNIHTIQAATFQDQTRFMRNKAIEAHRGGFIIECTINKDGSVNRLKCEFLNTFI